MHNQNIGHQQHKSEAELRCSKVLHDPGSDKKDHRVDTNKSTMYVPTSKITTKMAE